MFGEVEQGWRPLRGQLRLRVVQLVQDYNALELPERGGVDVVRTTVIRCETVESCALTNEGPYEGQDHCVEPYASASQYKPIDNIQFLD